MFDIPAETKSPDGGHLQFSIRSDISYSQFQLLLSEKMCTKHDCKPRYRFSHEGRTRGFINVHNQEALDQFIEICRIKLIAKRTKNGEPSNKRPRVFFAVFEDTEDERTRIDAKKSSDAKKVSKLFHLRVYDY